MDILTTDSVRASYSKMKGTIMPTLHLRECERDALSLLEMETDWAGLRDGLALDGVHMAGAELDGRMLLRVRDDVRRAKDSVSLISDERYHRIVERHEDTPEDSSNASVPRDVDA